MIETRPISSIKVGDRIRHDLGDVEQLAIYEVIAGQPKPFSMDRLNMSERVQLGLEMERRITKVRDEFEGPIPTALYRVFNEDGVLLYVGISGDPGKRFEQHRLSQPWWDEIVQSEFEWFGSRSAALQAEAGAIKGEDPLFNKAGRR